MADSKVEHKREEHAAHQDDLLWTTKLAASQSQALNGRRMPGLKSKIAGILDEKFERFFKTVERLEQRAKEGSIESRISTEPANRADRADRDLNSKMQAGIVEVTGTLGKALGEFQKGLASSPAGTESRDSSSRNSGANNSARQQQAAQRARQQLARATEVQRSWVALTAQILGVNLKRLGVAPSELDDIRLHLIREGALSYERLKELTRLPDSLDPSSELKVLEDIKVLMMAYVVQTTQEQILEELDTEDDRGELGLPKTIANKLLDIPEIDVDPNKLIELGLSF